MKGNKDSTTNSYLNTSVNKTNPPNNSTCNSIYDKFLGALKGNSGHLVQTITTFAISKSALTIITQPVQVALNTKQTNPAFTTKEVWKHAFTKKGPFRGLYAALFRSWSRDVLYKSLLFTDSPIITRKFFSRLNSQVPNDLLVNLSAGVLAGGIDTALGGPIDRYKTYITTSNKGSASLGNFVQGKPLFELMKEFYRGSGVMLFKNCSSMGAFFSLNQCMNDSMNSHYKNDDSNGKAIIPWYAKTFSALFTGIGVAIVSVPSDMIKTQIQKYNSIQKDNALEAISNIYKTHGLRALGSGAGFKLFMVVSGYAVKAMAVNFINDSKYDVKDPVKAKINHGGYTSVIRVPAIKDELNTSTPKSREI